MGFTEKWYGIGYSNNSIFNQGKLIEPTYHEKTVNCTCDRARKCKFGYGAHCEFNIKTGRLRTLKWDEEKGCYARDEHGQTIKDNPREACHYYTPKEERRKHDGVRNSGD